VGLDLLPAAQITKESSVTSSWFSRITALSVIAGALACACVAPVAFAADPPASDTTKAVAPALSQKDAERAAEQLEKQQKAEEKAKEEASKKAKRDMEIKADLAAGHPWIEGANWMSFRIGSATSTVKNAPDANIAVGFGMYHFLNRRWAGAFHADLDVLGRFGGGSEMELPLTLEMTRHMDWKTSTMRPYLGLGTGVWFHRYYRTGDDEAEVRPGIYLSTGVNSPIGARSMLGMDVRLTFQGSAASDNPMFPNEESTAFHWSLKLNYLRWGMD
jgi:hypothetical protein